MLLPVRSKNPPDNLPVVTVALIAMNTLIYAVTSNGWQIKEKILQEWGLKGAHFDAPHILSSMFLHGSILHLLGNMWFLYLFGFAVEGRLKGLKFLALYLVAGVTGDLLHQLLVGVNHPNMPSIGASGAIMGVLGAALWMFPHAKVTAFYWFGIFWRGTFDVPMWGVALWYLGFDVLWAVLSVSDGVGHLAHVGGALGGLIMCMAYRPVRDSALASDAKATLAEVQDLKLLTRMELEELHRMKPEDTAIVLNWMHRSMRDPGGIRDNCRETFVRMLPLMLREQDVRAVATCVAMIPEDSVAPNMLIQMAGDLEKVGDHVSANRFYDLIHKHPKSTDADFQVAAFRMGMLAETVYRDYARAWAWYGYVLEKWPMGPFASQSQARMAVIKRMSEQTPKA